MSLSHLYKLALHTKHYIKISFYMVVLNAGYTKSLIQKTYLSVGNGKCYEIIVDFNNYPNQNITMHIIKIGSPQEIS